MNLDSDYFKESAECTWPRGQLNCHHIAALVIFAHYNVSSTDKAGNWSVPKRGTDEKVERISEMYPTKKQFRALKSDIAQV